MGQMGQTGTNIFAYLSHPANQIMIAIDPTKFGTVEENDAVIDAILADIKASTPARPDGEVRWPGEGMLRTIKENRELGVPVVEEIWESVLKM